MAYSDYGGYAFRNGERIESRSDCTITPEGDTFGTPGMWPGFGMVAAGVTGDELKRRLEWPSGHAVLGDGPVYVVLYKQSSMRIYRGPEEVDVLPLVPPERIKTWTGHREGVTHRWLDTEHFKETEEPCVITVDGCTIEAYFLIEDNHYQYVRLTQPDGTVWTGWSGYGVGAGLEECGYGYSTEERNETLARLFPATEAANV